MAGQSHTTADILVGGGSGGGISGGSGGGSDEEEPAPMITHTKTPSKISLQPSNAPGVMRRRGNIFSLKVIVDPEMMGRSCVYDNLGDSGPHGEFLGQQEAMTGPSSSIANENETESDSDESSPIAAGSCGSNQGKESVTALDLSHIPDSPPREIPEQIVLNGRGASDVCGKVRDGGQGAVSVPMSKQVPKFTDSESEGRQPRSARILPTGFYRWLSAQRLQRPQRSHHEKFSLPEFVLKDVVDFFELQFVSNGLEVPADLSKISNKHLDIMKKHNTMLSRNMNATATRKLPMLKDSMDNFIAKRLDDDGVKFLSDMVTSAVGGRPLVDDYNKSKDVSPYLNINSKLAASTKVINVLQSEKLRWLIRELKAQKKPSQAEQQQLEKRILRDMIRMFVGKRKADSVINRSLHLTEGKSLSVLATHDEHTTLTRLNFIEDGTVECIRFDSYYPQSKMDPDLEEAFNYVLTNLGIKKGNFVYKSGPVPKQKGLVCGFMAVICLAESLTGETLDGGLWAMYVALLRIWAYLKLHLWAVPYTPQDACNYIVGCEGTERQFMLSTRSISTECVAKRDASGKIVLRTCSWLWGPMIAAAILGKQHFTKYFPPLCDKMLDLSVVVRAVYKILTGNMGRPLQPDDIMKNPDCSGTLYFTAQLQDAVSKEMQERFFDLYLSIHRWIDERLKAESLSLAARAAVPVDACANADGSSSLGPDVRTDDATAAVLFSEELLGGQSPSKDIRSVEIVS